MINVSSHKRLNPDTCPKLIASIREAWADWNARGVTIYKGYAYHIDSMGVWTCHQGAERTLEFDSYSD